MCDTCERGSLIQHAATQHPLREPLGLTVKPKIHNITNSGDTAPSFNAISSFAHFRELIRYKNVIAMLQTLQTFQTGSRPTCVYLLGILQSPSPPVLFTCCDYFTRPRLPNYPTALFVLFLELHQSRATMTTHYLQYIYLLRMLRFPKPPPGLQL